MNKIFYCEEEEEFYNIKFSDKTITIDWIKNLPAHCKEGEELDQNVFYISELPFIVKKNKPDKYCMQYFNKTEILLYPFRSGTPFYLRQATEEDVRNQIKDCEKWCVSAEYHEKILQSIKASTNSAEVLQVRNETLSLKDEIAALVKWCDVPENGDEVMKYAHIIAKLRKLLALQDQ